MVHLLAGAAALVTTRDTRSQPRSISNAQPT
jgi:hypothetical protein